MKKIMMFVAALAIAVSFVSCQGREAQSGRRLSMS